MSRIINSFKNQVGRDAGKVVSNLIFGDKHSTPIRRTDAYKTQRQVKAEQLEKDLQADKITRLESDISNQIEDIQYIKFGGVPPEEIMNILDNLSIKLNFHSWKSGDNEEEKIKNKLSDAFLKKYKQGLASLQKLADEETVLPYLNDYKKIRKKRFFKKYQVEIILGSVFLFIFLCFAIMGIIENL